MGSEAGVTGRRVRVSEACAAQDGRHVNASLQALLAESEALKVWQAEAERRAVDDCVAEDIVAHAVVVRCSGLIEADELLGVIVRVFRTGGHCRVLHVLERPRAPLLVVQKAGVVVALVKVLEDGAEDLWLLVWETDAALAWGREELITTCRSEPRGSRQDILVRGEQTLVLADDNGDDCTVQLGRGASDRRRRLRRRRLVQGLAHPLLGVIAERAFRHLSRLARAIFRRGKGPLEHGESVGERSGVPNERGNGRGEKSVEGGLIDARYTEAYLDGGLGG